MRYEDILWYDFGQQTKQITIVPLADVHLGAEGSAWQQFYKLIDAIKDEPDTYVTLQGDMIDNGLKNSVTNVYRATMRPYEQKREMTKALEPIRDKILCIIPGNHERRSSKEVDADPTYDIAAKLDLEDRYRESIAFLRVGLGKRTSGRNSKPYVYYIACMHGAGGGALPGAGVNRNDRYLQALDGVDILITAHGHKPYAHRGSKIILDVQNRIVTARPTLHMMAGSWLGYVGYPIEKQMVPVAMPGANKLILSGTKYRFEAVV